MNVLLYYLIIMNIIGLSLMGFDKSASKGKGVKRISENSLFMISFFGGSIGTICGMYLFNHKTRKLQFKLGVPVIIVLQIISIYYIWMYL